MISIPKFHPNEVLSAEKLNQLSAAIEQVQRIAEEARITDVCGGTFVRSSTGTTITIPTIGHESPGITGTPYVHPFAVSVNYDDGTATGVTIEKGLVCTTHYRPPTPYHTPQSAYEAGACYQVSRLVERTTIPGALPGKTLWLCVDRYTVVGQDTSFRLMDSSLDNEMIFAGTPEPECHPVKVAWFSEEPDGSISTKQLLRSDVFITIGATWDGV